ncbi:MAG: PIN domain-containing protein [Isosphaeraceae bacterium]
MLLIVIRAVFIFVVAGLGVRTARIVGEFNLANPYLLFIGVMLAAVGVLIGDLLTPRKRIQTISGVYFGVIVGIFLTNLVTEALHPTMELYLNPRVHMMVSSFLMIFICYVCISTLLQTKDDFRFIIPYMEFSKEVKGARPLVLDTSVVIDGRIADVAETRVIDQPMVVPRFVLQELQSIADSSDKLRRNRGRRGLDILNRLQKSQGIEVRIHDAEIPELAGVREVDQRLVVLAKHLGGKVVTNDYNLNKIARLQGVEVINLNDLANAMKPIVLPGENLTVKLLKRGEEPGQGIGYLDDGTMVVAEQGAYHLGDTVRLTVTSVLQTSAGRMIFGRIEAGHSPRPGPNSGPAGHQDNPGPGRPQHHAPTHGGPPRPGD